MSRRASILAVTALVLGLGLPAAAQDVPEYGPADGTLVVAGGGDLDGTGIFERFIELGGGPAQGRFVIVPTAGGNRTEDGALKTYDADEVLRPWKARGLSHVTMLHTADPKVADTDAFVKDLRVATAVWFIGGRQWNIVDSYEGTRTLKEFRAVLGRGGVIGGTSAGATIQGRYLVRGDTASANVMMTKEANHQRGFDFLRQTAIDQHINTRNRWDDLIPVMRAHPDLLGLGLSERTAIVVSGDTFEVIGRWKVAIHDNARLHQPWEKPYFVLSTGDAYNMKTRRIVTLDDGTRKPGDIASLRLMGLTALCRPHCVR